MSPYLILTPWWNAAFEKPVRPGVYQVQQYGQQEISFAYFDGHWRRLCGTAEEARQERRLLAWPQAYRWRGHCTYSASSQVGEPGNCYMAQVFGPDGESVATIDSTEDPTVATLLARRLATFLSLEGAAS